MVSCLKSYSPHKRSALRSSKKKLGKFPDAKQDQIFKIIEHLDRIHQLNTKTDFANRLHCEGKQGFEAEN